MIISFATVVLAFAIGGPASARDAPASSFIATCCGPPGPPANLTAYPVSGSEIDLSWEPPAGGSAPDYYNVYWGTSPDSESPITVTGTSYNVTELVPGTTYYFKVTAVTSDGESDASNPELATTTFDPPAKLNASPVSGSEIDLSWEPPADGSAPDHYNVYWGTSSGSESQSRVVTSPTDTVTGLVPDTTYYFYVTAADTSGNESNQSDPAQAMTPCSSPDPPAKLNASPVSGSEIRLSWDPPADGSAPDYLVYQGTSPDSESQITDTTDTSYTVPGLTPGTTNYFAVTIVNACGNVSDSSNTSATIPPNEGNTGPGQSATPSQSGTPRQSGTPSQSGPTKPKETDGDPRHPGSSRSATPPLGLIITAVRGSAVDLSWTRPNGHSIVDGYNVYIGTRPGLGNIGTPANPVTITRTKYTVTGLTPGTTYYFRVTTVDNSQHESSASKEAHVTTALTPRQPAPPTHGTGRPWVTIAVGPVGLLALAIGGALLLARLRSRRAAARGGKSAARGGQSATGADIAAVPDPGPPATVSVRVVGTRTGTAGTGTVRFVPRPGTSSITIEKVPPR